MKTPEGSKLKAEIVRAALKRHDILQLHFDGTANGVCIPERLRAREHVVFEIGLSMPVPIPDLLITDAAVEGTLSFGGHKVFVVVPFEALWAVTPKDGGGGALFVEDAPETVRAGLAPQVALPPAPAPTAPAGPGAKVMSLDAASRRLRGRPLRRGTASGTFPTTWEP